MQDGVAVHCDEVPDVGGVQELLEVLQRVLLQVQIPDVFDPVVGQFQLQLLLLSQLRLRLLV